MSKELQIIDTLSGDKKPLKPLHNEVQLFVCGPTVYDDTHIGHARTYIAFDVIARWIRHQGFNLRYLQNITDIDDKIIARAREEKNDALTIAHNFEERYHEDMRALRVDEDAINYPRASDYVDHIVQQIERLLEGGHAYVAGEGSVYFSVASFDDYGKLSHQNVEGAKEAVRIEKDPNKRDPADFVIWRGRPNADRWEPTWNSPWGAGRPGWHIEDTAITEQEFGEQYDLHGGARDLIFPHHEGEIALMESLSGKSPLVNHWLHTGFLNLKGEKMSKSDGNTISVRSILKQYRAEDFRLFVLQSHYRSPIDYSEGDLDAAAQAVNRIQETYQRLDQLAEGACAPHGDLFADEHAAITTAMNDDFQTPLALATIFTAIKRINAGIDDKSIAKDEACAALGFLTWVDQFLAIVPPPTDNSIPAEIKDLAKEREEARATKDWARADKLREQSISKGYDIRDTDNGPDIRKQ